MLGIDESGKTTGTLCISDDMLTKGSFTGRLRAIDFSDTPLWHTTDTESQIESDRPGGNSLNLNSRGIAQLHDCAFAKTAFDLSEGKIYRLLAIAHTCGCSGSAIAIYSGFFFFTH